DSEQRKASHEVVMIKVPEEKLEIEPSKPEIIRARNTARPETKILGKIDLEPKKQEVPVEKPEEKPEEKPREEVVLHSPASEKQEFKVLDKIDLSQMEGNKPRAAKKEDAKPEKVDPPAAQPASEPAAAAPAPEHSAPAQSTPQAETPAQVEPASDVHETV